MDSVGISIWLIFLIILWSFFHFMEESEVECVECGRPEQIKKMERFSLSKKGFICVDCYKKRRRCDG